MNEHKNPSHAAPAPSWASVRDGALNLEIRVVPGARKSEIAGIHDQSIKIRLCAPPVDGQANRELARFLANFLGLRQNQVSIVRGETSRSKLVRITGGNLQSVIDSIASSL